MEGAKFSAWASGRSEAETSGYCFGASSLAAAYAYVIRWARRKFKRLRHKTKGARDWFERLRRANPGLFAHWQLCHGNGRTSGVGMPAETRATILCLSSPVLIGQSFREPPALEVVVVGIWGSLI
jgi:hypothetical protein